MLGADAIERINGSNGNPVRGRLEQRIFCFKAPPANPLLEVERDEWQREGKGEECHNYRFEEENGSGKQKDAG